jgi:hypothetical protein
MSNGLDHGAKLKKLSDYILNVLRESQEYLQLEALKAALPEFVEISDGDWYSVLKDLESDALINARFITTGIDNAIRGAFNIAITARGRQLTPELPLRGRRGNLEEGNSVQVVTLTGECFRATFKRTEVASDRDGVYYLFDIEDLIKNRGHRLVSLFRSGQNKELRSNFDAIIANVRINAIRHAVDSRIINFDAPFEEYQYQQIKLRPEDFGCGTAATDAQVREFISHKAYWLGFRYNSHQLPPAPIQFDISTDLDYLIVSRACFKNTS